MNLIEKKIVSLLQDMRAMHGVVGVKAEFEAEGTRFEELLRLKDIASHCGLGVSLKIGGSEDVWGILQARRVGVMDIVAPMVESAYALSKFLEAAKKHIPADERDDIVLAINVETFSAYKCIRELLATGGSELESVTVGRVDLVGSLGIGREKINSDMIFHLTREICEESKKNGKRITMGGGVESNAHSFITRLVEAGLLDRFETRKIIFDAPKGLANFHDALRSAHQFELLWLLNKQSLYQAIAGEDKDRIPMLEKRIKELEGDGK